MITTQAHSDNEVLTIRQARKMYDEVTALHGVDLVLQPTSGGDRHPQRIRSKPFISW